MKHVYLSDDCEVGIYLVPDAVADDLSAYCLQFLKWISTSDRAREKYTVKWKGRDTLSYYPEDAFIEWLNTEVFPGENARFVSLAKEPISDEDTVPWFNF
ncbi:MAG: hypothetical protein IJR51_04315 [Clostridia bacterium]|nr:hypothetical protein [Clostridia bacterium]MBR5422674.1 hypothetical protein [Clostridia bacterium]